MSAECRFTWDAADRDCYERGGRPADRAVLSAAGKPIYTWYHCDRCRQIHWCLPACEMDGTAPSFDEAVNKAMDIAEQAGFGNATGKRNWAPHNAASPA